MRDYPGQLGLVPHAEQQAGKDHRKTAREHHRIEVRNVRQVDAEILSRSTADFTNDSLEVAG